MKLKNLSVIPYYGGKYAMAPFISDLINKTDCDTYCEVFGGGARVLLNKPPHEEERYYELDKGVCALFKMLSNETTAMELIRRICMETYTEDNFYL